MNKPSSLRTNRRNKVVQGTPLRQAARQAARQVEGVAAEAFRQTFRQAFRSNLVRMAIEAGDVIEVVGAGEMEAVAASPLMEGVSIENVKKKQGRATTRP